MSTAPQLDRYPSLCLCVAGQFLSGAGRRSLPVVNPATEEVLGQLPVATLEDIDAALESTARGFETWRVANTLERSHRLRRVAELIRSRRETIAGLITRELGKPFQDALLETTTAAEMFEWASEETRRLYGRTIPSRTAGVRLVAERVPVGPVAGFSGWNAPLITPSRKIAGALGAGCSIIIKPAESTPAVALALMSCVLDAGVPKDAVNMLFGDPAIISERLLKSPIIRLITFTGSVAIGKQLAVLAAQTMKRTIMELGGHAPAVICDDVDVALIAKAAATAKFRFAGQVCTSPTRFYVQRNIYDDFVARFIDYARSLRVGNGLEPGVQMGPLANESRRRAIEGLVQDALARGATRLFGGERLGDVGYFYAPTVLGNLPKDCRAMTEEPFGPLALMSPFDDDESVVKEANSLPFGLAAYVCTNNTKRMTEFRERIESGVLAFNHFVASWAESPFGGVKDSGLGTEGGVEGMQNFQQVRLISEA
jgi:succinate-semialdehyde dehydrogenase / glutarate-semialdehyde dehydrogenase